MTTPPVAIFHIARLLDAYGRSLDTNETARARQNYADTIAHLSQLLADAAPIRLDIGGVVIEVTRAETEGDKS